MLTEEVGVETVNAVALARRVVDGELVALRERVQDPEARLAPWLGDKIRAVSVTPGWLTARCRTHRR